MVPVTRRRIWTHTKLRYGDCFNASEDMGSYKYKIWLLYLQSRQGLVHIKDIGFHKTQLNRTDMRLDEQHELVCT